MSEANLKAAIQLNADQFNAAIQKIRVKLDELSAQIQSLPSGDKQLNKISKEFARTSEVYNRLIGGLEKLGTEADNTAPKLEKTGNASKSARTALTSLSLTIQDLPFGFIGIQNNLPGVIQGFGNLTTTTNGKVLPALKEIGNLLIGPAGIFLAFSAVTSAITYAIQEYGSLGNAINALFNSQNALTKEQRDFAKNLANESTEIVTLVSLYKGFQGDREKQLEIIQKLNQIAPEYFGNLKDEKDNIDELTKSLDKYINSFIGKIYIESQQKKINELITKYAERITTVIDKELERQKRVQTTRDNIDGLKQSNDQLFKSTIENIKKIPKGDIGVGVKPVVVKGTTQQVIDDLKTELKKNLQGVLKGLDVFGQYITLEDLPKPKPTKAEEAKYLTRIYDVFFPEDFNEFKKRAKKFAQLQEDFFTRQRLAVPNVGGPMKNDLRSQFLPDKEDLKYYEDYLSELTKIFDKRSRQIGSTIRGFIQQPLSELFDMLLTKGASSWKQFGDIVISVLKRIATELITSAITSVLANILAPGSGAGVSKLLKGFSTSTLGEYLNNFPSQANFGGLSGNMGISGQVVFVQRGSDLVGVLNRTNETINRVG